MARQYSVSRLTYRIVALFCAAFLAVSPAKAQEDPYIVKGVKVDVTAGNAVEARQKAFDQAQQAAYVQLAQHFLTPDQMKGFTPPPANQITPLVDDFELTNEQLSAVRYIGTYTFKFRHNATRGLAAHMAAAAPNPGPAVETGGTDTISTTTATSTSTASAGAYDGVYNPSAATGNALTVRVHFASMAEWIRMQKALRRVPGVQDVQLTSLSPGSALVDLRYQGSESTVRAGLAQAGMVLGTAAADTDSLNPIYDLSTTAYGMPGAQ